MSSNAANSTLTPAEQVVNTTELLEHILSSLPMPHVLGKSRVSHDWKALIDNSPTLQKKLFLRHNENQNEVLSPDHWFPKPQDWPRELDAKQLDLLFSLVDTPVYTTPIELNPLINWENQADLHVTHELRVAHPKPFLPSLTGLGIVLGKYSRAYARHRFGTSSQTTQTNSSWRNMHLTSPPVTDVVIHIPTSAGSWTEAEQIRVNVHAEHGVTLGLLRDRVEETLKKFRMKDGRHRAEKRKNGPLQEKDYVKGWGKKENVMFLIQPTEGAADLASQ